MLDSEDSQSYLRKTEPSILSYTGYWGGNMMCRLVSIWIALIIAFTGSINAEVLEVPLPALHGWYGIDGTCICHATTRFELGRMPIAINSVSIRLRGAVHVGQYWCDFGPRPDTSAYRYYFSASIRDTVSGYPWGAGAFSLEESGALEVVAAFGQVIIWWPVTWDFLLAGYGYVDLDAMPEGIIVDCHVLDWPSATIEEATLIVDGEFEVSVDQTTWGSIKALFR